MVDDTPPWERIKAIWDAICVSEGYQTSIAETAETIREKFGENAAQSYTASRISQQEHIESMQLRMRPVQNTRH